MSPNDAAPGPLVVGVVPRQHPEVIAQASLLAGQLGRSILFAFVQPNSYLTEWDLKGNITDQSLHPGDLDDDMTADALGILDAIEAQMADCAIVWTLRILAGEPWKALARLASESRGSMIIVGTRKPGVGAQVSEWLGGATASHLAAHQHRPVLVVPRIPTNPKR
ncbi:universal stress protein [Paeniglutamicibacter sulfureus]|uniref:universal stress protein n=1 Tax=Paeniglutamicibacter sulfureus TaxID=43666 RepID=UPI002666141D|nr:universal stress protein [Paeniglutamicibacter sulfureus]MDO2934121.1 universal stress protein [Paeniglutamicibacter sulfureus]